MDNISIQDAEYISQSNNLISLITSIEMMSSLKISLTVSKAKDTKGKEYYYIKLVGKNGEEYYYKKGDDDSYKAKYELLYSLFLDKLNMGTHLMVAMYEEKKIVQTSLNLLGAESKNEAKIIKLKH